MRRRVVITGVGAVNPCGNDAETAWKALREGRKPAYFRFLRRGD